MGLPDVPVPSSSSISGSRPKRPRSELLDFSSPLPPSKHHHASPLPPASPLPFSLLHDLETSLNASAAPDDDPSSPQEVLVAAMMQSLQRTLGDVIASSSSSSTSSDPLALPPVPVRAEDSIEGTHPPPFPHLCGDGSPGGSAGALNLPPEDINPCRDSAAADNIPECDLQQPAAMADLPDSLHGANAYTKVVQSQGTFEAWSVPAESIDLCTDTESNSDKYELLRANLDSLPGSLDNCRAGMGDSEYEGASTSSAGDGALSSIRRLLDLSDDDLCVGRTSLDDYAFVRTRDEQWSYWLEEGCDLNPFLSLSHFDEDDGSLAMARDTELLMLNSYF